MAMPVQYDSKEIENMLGRIKYLNFWPVDLEKIVGLFSVRRSHSHLVLDCLAGGLKRFRLHGSLQENFNLTSCFGKSMIFQYFF